MMTLGKNISVLCSYRSYCGHTLITPQMASEASEVLIVRSWMPFRDAITTTPGASPPRLGGRTGRDEFGACIGKGQAKSHQRRKALV